MPVTKLSKKVRTGQGRHADLLTEISAKVDEVVDAVNANPGGSGLDDDGVAALVGTSSDTQTALDARYANASTVASIAADVAELGTPVPGDDGAPGRGVDTIVYGSDPNTPRTGAIDNQKIWIGNAGVTPVNYLAGDIIGRGASIAVPGPEIPTFAALLHHWRASDINIADGATVTAWAPRAGSVSFLTGAGTPAYIAAGPNGKPAVAFVAASTEYLNAAIGTRAQPTTVIIVARFTAVAANERLITSQSITTPNRAYIGISSGGNFVAATGSTSRTGPSASPGGVADLNWHIFGANFGGTSGNFRFDGTSSAGDIGTESISGLRIGANGDASNPADMEIAEILVYSKLLDGTEWATVRNLLKDWYALP